MSLIYLEGAYKAGKNDLAEKIRQSVRRDLEQQRRYYNYIRDSRPELYGGFERSEAPINEAMLQVLTEIEKKYAPQLQSTLTPSEGNNTIINSPASKDSTKPDSLK